jgi:hypothetical protein
MIPFCAIYVSVPHSYSLLCVVQWRGSLADRLWLQRPLPSSRNSKKRSRITGGSNATDSKKQRRSKGQSQYTSVFTDTVDLSPAVTQSVRGRNDAIGVVASRGSRVAKTQANMKLGAQAKDLAEFQKQMTIVARGRSKFEPPPLRRPTGTRVSARLRADIVEDGWQSVPEEWLAEDFGSTIIAESAESVEEKWPEARKIGAKRGLESDCDSISDLTELSSDDPDANRVAATLVTLPVTSEPTSFSDDGRSLDHEVSGEEIPADCVEWETVRTCKRLIDRLY